jgi:hypothetical protein
LKLLCQSSNVLILFFFPFLFRMSMDILCQPAEPVWRFLSVN